MRNFRLFCTNLLGLCFLFSDSQTEGFGDSGSLPPTPNISHFSDKQSLGVSWPRNQGASERDVYEIQISRTENHTIIYNRNVSISAGDSAQYTWTWLSDLPLECVDHSVRMRSFCHQTGPSPWSNWITNHGTKARDKFKIFPSQSVLKEGSNVMFCCVAPVGVNITSITFKDMPYPLLNIGDGVKAILVSNLAIPTNLIKILSVTCTDSAGKTSSVGKSVSFPPQRPRNLSCTTSDMINIRCSWDPGRKRDQYDRNNQTQTLHIENTDQAPIPCQSSSCIFPAVPQRQEYNIRVEVKDQLGEEMATYSFNISDRVSPVLEWDRVIPEVTEVSLSWTVLGNLTQNNFLCQVSVDTETISKQTLRSENGLCKVRLEGLHPNMGYSAKARCSVNGRLWGKWTWPVLFTTCPLVTLDLWRRIDYRSDSDIRRVTLLWKPHVFGRATTVKIQAYTVKWSQEGQTLTEPMDSRQSQADISIGPKKCNFTVQAVLNNGSSIPAHITILPKDNSEIPLLKKSLNKTSAGGFSLWWDERTSVTCGYTVEWCILGGSASCTLQWIKVPKGNNTLFLPPGHFKSGCRYSFNIYGCTEHGDKLLEIQTGYTQELRSVKYPSLIKLVKSTHASVTLEWHYDEEDAAQPAFITGYLVTVQKVQSDTAPVLFNVSVGDPRQKSLTIEGLQQHQEYVCSVSALTKVGPGLPASITIRTKTNYFSHLTKILTPILLLLGCTALLLKNVLKKIFAYPAGMNIKTPEFESFLNEIDQKLQSHKVEECIGCDIEVMHIKPLWHESTILRTPEHTNTMCSPAFQPSLPPSCVPLQTGYCPQSTVLLCERPIHQQIMCIANKSYLSMIAEPQEVEFTEIRSSFEKL
ncbi:leukemia inhibitory factor receptor isoform X3 [Girardinichthys multiradiatus]|uniref:leukemia inhibitory factor receptor isoform X3 n=1 Tax=Girardinichthys multiradiatus TaxID=208333 RepID=UPI001FABCBA4|nr:leukemia inhibitory factor receptor isoform X3 [Girardinichthys multiradiatus]